MSVQPFTKLIQSSTDISLSLHDIRKIKKNNKIHVIYGHKLAKYT